MSLSLAYAFNPALYEFYASIPFENFSTPESKAETRLKTQQAIAGANLMNDYAAIESRHGINFYFKVQEDKNKFCLGLIDENEIVHASISTSVRARAEFTALVANVKTTLNENGLDGQYKLMRSDDFKLVQFSAVPKVQICAIDLNALAPLMR